MLLAARDQLQNQLAAGKVVDIAALLKLDEALREHIPTGEPAGVQLTIQAAKLCAKCGAALEAEPPPVAEERPSPPPSKPRASSNVVPLKQPQRTIDNGTS
jgi:hypothetical protein